MKKILAMILAGLMVLSLAACGDAEASTTAATTEAATTLAATTEAATTEAATTEAVTTEATTTESADTDPTLLKVEAAVAAAIGDTYLSTVELSGEDLGDYFGLDMTQVEDAYAKEAEITSINSDTIILLNCKEGYADQAVETFNELFNHYLSYARLYNFGVAKVEGTRIYKVDNYVMFILEGREVAAELTAEEEAANVVEDYGKIDEAITEIFGVLPENLAVAVESEDGGQGGGAIGGLIVG